MTHTNSELRKQARNFLEGNWGILALATLVYYLIAESVPLSGNFFGESGNWFSLWSLLCLPLGWGLSILCLGITRGEDPTIGGLFQGYRQFGRIFIAYLWYTVLIVLWTLLLIVPGIIKALSYSMMPFILKDHPEMNGDHQRKYAPHAGTQNEALPPYLEFYRMGSPLSAHFWSWFLVAHALHDYNNGTILSGFAG